MQFDYSYAEENFNQKKYYKRKSKRERNKKHKRRLKNLWNAKQHSYPYPVLYIEHEIKNRKVPYYKKNTPSHGGKSQKYFKQQANRHVRQYNSGISNGCGYKKIYDYQWIIH